MANRFLTPTPLVASLARSTFTRCESCPQRLGPENAIGINLTASKADIERSRFVIIYLFLTSNDTYTTSRIDRLAAARTNDDRDQKMPGSPHSSWYKAP